LKFAARVDVGPPLHAPPPPINTSGERFAGAVPALPHPLNKEKSPMTKRERAPFISVLHESLRSPNIRR
jgi:hypothetical protein